MYKKSTSSLLAASLMLSLATAHMPAVAAVVNAEWINGNGNYSDDTKWNIPAVPCNAGSTTFNVNIPANSGTISDDVSICVVDTFILGDNSTFKILAGSSYTVLGQADIFGILHGMGGNFTASSAAFSGNRARAYAELGSIINIPAISYSSTGLASTTTLFSAANPGSLLDVSSLQDINAGWNDGSTTVRVNSITSSDSGVIDLSGLLTVTAPAQPTDRLDFNVNGGIMDLLSLNSISGGGATRFNITSGSLSLPALNTVGRAQFWVSGGSSLIANGSLWGLSLGSSTGTTLWATGAGSLLDVSSLQDINAGWNDGSTTVRVNSIRSENNGEINLSGLQTVTAPAQPTDRLDISVSDTAVIDCLHLQPSVGAEG